MSDDDPIETRPAEAPDVSAAHPITNGGTGTGTGAGADTGTGTHTGEGAGTERVRRVAMTVARIRRPGARARTVLRWSTAAVLCLGLGAGTAFAVVAPERTDIPGLATPTDGRYTYPALRLPELPAGASGPLHGGAPSGQPGGTVPHAADIRQLLLPVPVGGVVDPAYPGAKGWLSESDYAGLFADPATASAQLTQNGARHVAAVGWRMPDGTHVTVCLVAFRSTSSGQAVWSAESALQPAAAPGLSLAPTNLAIPVGEAETGSRPAGGGKPALRLAVFSDEDVVGLLVMSNPKAVNPADFDQALILQTQMLGG